MSERCQTCGGSQIITVGRCLTRMPCPECRGGVEEPDPTRRAARDILRSRGVRVEMDLWRTFQAPASEDTRVTPTMLAALYLDALAESVLEFGEDEFGEGRTVKWNKEQTKHLRARLAEVAGPPPVHFEANAAYPGVALCRAGVTQDRITRRAGEVTCPGCLRALTTPSMPGAPAVPLGEQAPTVSAAERHASDLPRIKFREWL